MSLPIIIEVAIGLVFIYVVLSLLASELQEILGTLLQWRASHLKRSIEVLLAGNDSDDQDTAIAFADNLYRSPLICALNQEATGLWSHLPRQINHIFGQIYRTITHTRNVFGEDTSGPSKIPTTTFAQTLLENLQLDSVRTLIMDTRLRRFVEERVLLPVNHMVNDLRASTANEFLLNGEVRQLEQTLGQVLKDFQEQRASLGDTLDRLLVRLDEFTAITQATLPEQHHLTETFTRRLRYLRQTVAYNDLDKAALLRRIQPSLRELVTVLEKDSPLYRELMALANRDGGMAKAVMERLETQPMPTSLRRNLQSMAQEVESRVAELQTDITQLKQATEAWFDRGMERASGVYTRNARAVAFVMGIAVAVSFNADSFHMIDRFATDPILREAVAASATDLATQFPEDMEQGSPEFEQFQEEMNQIQQGVTLPIGYTKTVLMQQELAEASWQFFIPRRICGWVVTGIAVSMGAKFWFDLLKKVLHVREEGAPRSVSSGGTITDS